MSQKNYEYFMRLGMRVPVKSWTRHVVFDEKAAEQVANVASLPFIFKHIAVMPDVHWGLGATVGSVIPTLGAIVPSAVGVDIGCGMLAVRTNLTADKLPDDLSRMRAAIERVVPHGRSNNGGRNDRGAWGEPNYERANLAHPEKLAEILEKHPKLGHNDPDTVWRQLCSLGTGNHFIEICLDEDNDVWIMLHSGSRGVGNKIGTYFISQAKEQAEKYGYAAYLPDKDLAWLSEDTPIFNDYIEALLWAQNYAAVNRMLMLRQVKDALNEDFYEGGVHTVDTVINCHHNYAARENHFGQNIWVTRKGAVRARAGDLGIVPGSMGAKSYIVRGLGNPDSFHSCSHGAGREMSRGEAKRRISLEQHIKDTQGVECRKDEDVIDESPAAYKDIDRVIESERDLIQPIAKLKQIICVKG